MQRRHAFESMAGREITGGEGRQVKTIGDEVLFAANSPAGAGTIALALLDAVEADEERRGPPETDPAV